MYFTLKTPTRIGGKLYRTCICYEVTSYLELTVNKLVKEGKAELHEKFVFFCNGKPVEQKAEKFEQVEKPVKKAKGKKAEPKKEVEEEPPVVEYEAEDNGDLETLEGTEDF